MKGCEAYLMYHIDEALGCVFAETIDHLNLILPHKNPLDQEDEFVLREGTGS